MLVSGNKKEGTHFQDTLFFLIYGEGTMILIEHA